MRISARSRIRAPGGIFTVDSRGIATLAKKYGNGEVHGTTRQTLEIPHVKPDPLKKWKALEKNGTPVGSEKDEIVNIIACPGIERCKFANIDTISLAKKIDANSSAKRCRSRCGSPSRDARMPARARCSTR